jgi:hypothetical protein
MELFRPKNLLASVIDANAKDCRKAARGVRKAARSPMISTSGGSTPSML